jgi:hypothetical protein
MASLVPKHWIVTDYNLPTEDKPLGQAGGVSSMHALLTDAQDAARTLAAQNPQGVYVVAEAQWYARVDITPVQLIKVLGIVNA